MVPLIELRVAVPMAINLYHLPVLTSYVVCIIGNMLPVPVIFFFARKVLEWGKDKKVIGKFFTFCLEKGHKGGAKLQEKTGRGLYVALFLFVGIPIPGTGAWGRLSERAKRIYTRKRHQALTNPAVIIPTFRT